ncbi:hypothetical protein HaLaN_20739, partial [Haematococcus lacustris]
MNSPQPCEEELDRSKPTRPEDWKLKPGQAKGWTGTATQPLTSSGQGRASVQQSRHSARMNERLSQGLMLGAWRIPLLDDFSSPNGLVLYDVFT